MPPDAASWPQVKLKKDDCYRELAPHTAEMEKRKGEYKIADDKAM